MDQDTKEFATVGRADLARLLNIGRRAVAKLVRQPSFPSSITGISRERYSREQVLRWIAAHCSPAVPSTPETQATPHPGRSESKR